MFHSQNIVGEFNPTQDWLILEPVRESEKVGLLYIPDNKRAFGCCPVVCAGKDAHLKPGDVVWMQKFVEGELKFYLNGKAVYSIRERHVNVATKGNGLKPVGDRILVKRLEDSEPMRGGIHIPEAAQEKPQECEVIGVGPKAKTDVTKGDIILIPKYAGTEVKRDKLELTIINANDVVGIIKKVSVQTGRRNKTKQNHE